MPMRKHQQVLPGRVQPAHEQQRYKIISNLELGTDCIVQLSEGPGQELEDQKMEEGGRGDHGISGPRHLEPRKTRGSKEKETCLVCPSSVSRKGHKHHCHFQQLSSESSSNGLKIIEASESRFRRISKS